MKIATRGPAERQAITAITSITTGQGEPFSASVSASSTERTPATMPSNTSPPLAAAASMRASIQLARLENKRAIARAQEHLGDFLLGEFIKQGHRGIDGEFVDDQRADGRCQDRAHDGVVI